MNLLLVSLIQIFILLPSLCSCLANGSIKELSGSNESAQDIKPVITTSVPLETALNLNPLNTTVQIQTKSANQHLAILNKLLELGYGVQRVSGDQGMFLLGGLRGKSSRATTLDFDPLLIVSEQAGD